MRTLRQGAAALVGVCLLLAAGAAGAHTRSLTYSDWWLDEAGATVRVRLTPLDQAAIRLALDSRPGATPLDYLVERMRLRRGALPCAAQIDGAAALPLGRGRAGFEWRLDCPGRGDWQLESDVLFDEVAGHVELVTVRLAAEERTVEAVLSESHRTLHVGGPAEQRSAVGTLLSFGREGLAHIVSGWDHLLFLLVLVVGLAGLREVALAATGFTLGHSATLVGTALGWTTPHGPTVEALIALSIVVVAAENVWLTQERRSSAVPATMVVLVVVAALLVLPTAAVSTMALAGLAVFTAFHFGLLARSERPARLRVGLAALFGLLHGFGFAGALAEMSLPAGHRVLALAGFNLGVEVGQLAVVAMAVPLLALVSRFSKGHLTVVGSSLAAAVGAFWFVGRAFG